MPCIQLKEKLVGQVCHDVNERAFRGAHIEKFIQESEIRRRRKSCVSRGRGLHVISIIDSEKIDENMLANKIIDIINNLNLESENLYVSYLEVNQRKGHKFIEKSHIICL